MTKVVISRISVKICSKKVSNLCSIILYIGMRMVSFLWKEGYFVTIHLLHFLLYQIMSVNPHFWYSGFQLRLFNVSFNDFFIHWYLFVSSWFFCAKWILSGNVICRCINIDKYFPHPANLIYLNFQPLDVVSRYRDPQPQVDENYSYFF